MTKSLFILSLVLLASCARGPRGHQGITGSNGLTGQPGSAGPSGTPGQSCDVVSLANGAQITCGSNTVVVLNGADGEAGVDAVQTAYSITEVIAPCPGTGFREVLLRTAGNQILGHYSQGSRQFLTFLTPGAYQLTDGSSCNFTVHSDMQVTW